MSLKHYKPEDDVPGNPRPIAEASRHIQITYMCCLAIRGMEERGDMIKARKSWFILSQQVKINRAVLKLVE